MKSVKKHLPPRRSAKPSFFYAGKNICSVSLARADSKDLVRNFDDIAVAEPDLRFAFAGLDVDGDFLRLMGDGIGPFDFDSREIGRSTHDTRHPHNFPE